MSVRSIKDSLSKIMENNNEEFCIPCTVTSVSLTDKTCYCEPIDTGKADLMDVRLIADNKIGILIIPKVGSVVIVSMLSNELSYVSMFSEVDEIQLNGDNYDGIPIIGKLVTQLNNIENAFNAHLLLYNAHIHPETSVNTTSPTIPDVTNTLVPTTQTLIENLTVKHGNG